MKKYNCIFTGGAARGFCYAGVLKAFEENDIVIDNFAGSSIGALMMTFYSIGYSADEIEKEINNLNLLRLFCDFNFNFLSDCAVSQGKNYIKWLREKIEKKYYGKKYKKGKMAPVCFKDVKQNLYITATNLKDCSLMVFSKETTPNTEIALALRASSAMPSLLPPIKFEDKILIDGDILHAKPVWKTVKKLYNEQEELLEFRITGGNINKISKNPIVMINSIVNTAGYIIDDEAEDVYKNKDNIKLIKIDVPQISFTDFQLKREKKNEIYKIGYEKCLQNIF